ncbi:MAG: hypothetical protein KA250_03280 [Verrucomicrobiales bacterium]|nr:hypothetical protein [Verrucomicrobiales bacterium]MBP9223490.1 hypothetical protein [Verrucomicrobiales bacterium]HQZ26602.1 hypothetical protein [Verrucomicrobiales bacterium]
MESAALTAEEKSPIYRQQQREDVSHPRLIQQYSLKWESGKGIRTCFQGDPTRDETIL